MDGRRSRAGSTHQQQHPPVLEEQPLPAGSIHRRQTYENSLRALWQSVQDDTFLALHLSQVQDMLLQAETQFDRFEREHMMLISSPANEAQVPAYMEVHTALNAIYMQMRARLTFRVEELTPALPQPQVVTAKAPEVRVELQTPDALGNLSNTWGTFNGDYSQWHSFRDRFRAAVHNNERLPVMYKFQYLRNAVQGAAQRAMGTWKFTEQNYQRAWDRLCEIYEDDYLAVQTFIRRLLSIPRMEEQSYRGLRRIIDTVHECTQQLSNFVDVENWDPITVFMVIDLLDPVTYEAWETFREKCTTENVQDGQEEMETEEGAVGGVLSVPSSERRTVCIPSWQQMTLFLERRARILIHADARRDTSVSSERSQPPRRNDPSANRSAKPKAKPTAMQVPAASQSKPSCSGRQGAPTGYPPCPMCGEDHALYRCERFVQLSLVARREFVRANQRCSSCLRAEHGPDGCKSNTCARCPGNAQHNSLLCPTREAERRTNVLQLEDVEMTEAEQTAQGGAKKKVLKKNPPRKK